MAPNDETADTTEAAQDSAEDTTTGNAEAARYRTRLRAAEAERDALAERVTALQRAEVERVAGEHLRAPAALWVAGAQLGDLLDADGHADPAKVRDAATAAVDTLGLARPRPAGYVAREGTLTTPARSSGGWQDMLRGGAPE